MDALLKFLNNFPAGPNGGSPTDRMLADPRIADAVSDRLMRLNRQITSLTMMLDEKKAERDALSRFSAAASPGLDPDAPEPFDEAFYGPYGTEQQPS